MWLCSVYVAQICWDLLRLWCSFRIWISYLCGSFLLWPTFQFSTPDCICKNEIIADTWVLRKWCKTMWSNTMRYNTTWRSSPCSREGHPVWRVSLPPSSSDQLSYKSNFFCISSNRSCWFHQNCSVPSSICHVSEYYRAHWLDTKTDGCLVNQSSQSHLVTSSPVAYKDASWLRSEGGLQPVSPPPLSSFISGRTKIKTWSCPIHYLQR